MSAVKTISFFITLLFFASFAHALSEKEMATIFAEAIEDAGKYSLTEMRPTAKFNNINIERIRESEKSDGGEVKARVATYWTTAFTGKTRTTVIDVWLSTKSNEIYLTRYKLYSDDHNVPIANPQDARVEVKLGNVGKGKNDDF
jgi:hypothetical protein